jgi:hypothetical protein
MSDKREIFIMIQKIQNDLLTLQDLINTTQKPPINNHIHELIAKNTKRLLNGGKSNNSRD